MQRLAMDIRHYASSRQITVVNGGQGGLSPASFEFGIFKESLTLFATKLSS